MGWRGLCRELAELGFWKSSWVIGVVWGFWHAPLILQGHNYPQHPWAGVFMMTVMTVLLSPLLGYVTIKANSVIAAAFFHGTFNATAGLALMAVKGGNDLTVGVDGGCSVLRSRFCCSISGLLTLYDRRKSPHGRLTRGKGGLPDDRASSAVLKAAPIRQQARCDRFAVSIVCWDG